MMNEIRSNTDIANALPAATRTDAAYVLGLFLHIQWVPFDDQPRDAQGAVTARQPWQLLHDLLCKRFLSLPETAETLCKRLGALGFALPDVLACHLFRFQK